MKALAGELRKVCGHPCLVLGNGDDADGLGGNNIDHNGAVAAINTPFITTATLTETNLDNFLTDSPKLAVLDRLIQALLTRNKRSLLLTHSSQVSELLGKVISLRLGSSDSVRRVDATTPSADHRAAVEAFNEDDSPVQVMIMHPKVCGLGTDLPGIEAVVFFDTDWSLRSDIQALGHAFKLGSGDTPLPVYRLYCTGTVEERLLAMSDKMKGVDGMYAQGHGRAYSDGAKVFEELLTWGAADMFEAVLPAVGGEGGDGEEKQQEQQQQQGGSSDVDMADVADEKAAEKGSPAAAEEEQKQSSPAPAPAAATEPEPELYSEEQIRFLLDTDAASVLAKSIGGTETTTTTSTTPHSCSVGSPCEACTIIDLTPFKSKGLDESQPSEGSIDEDAGGDDEGDDGHHEVDATNVVGGGVQGSAEQNRAENALAASRFWGNLLRQSWMELQRGNEARALVDEVKWRCECFSDLYMFLIMRRERIWFY